MKKLITASIIMASFFSAYSNTITINQKDFEVSISHQKIATRVHELGAQISKDYANKNPLFIGVLNGAFIFLADLVREINVPCSIDFIQIASYHGTTESSGAVNLLKDVSSDITDRDIIIVEDIVDSGLSMQYLLEHLKKKNPRSIAIASLLHKNVAPLDFKIDYLGFSIPPEFVIGYGLDYAQGARNLKDIYRLVC